MEFGRKKCSLLVMKSGNLHIMEGVEIPKSSSHQNARRKGNLQIFVDIGS